MLLDVNIHVHHVPAGRWFDAHADHGWATCPVSESGFVRISSNPRILPMSVPVEVARQVLRDLRSTGQHRFLPDAVSMCDTDVPPLSTPRQVTDQHLLAAARRDGRKLVTFDRALAAGSPGAVELLTR